MNHAQIHTSWPQNSVADSLVAVVFFMNIVQVQEITMSENVWHITELIAIYCCKGLSHTVLGPTGVNLCMVLYGILRGMRSCVVVKEFYCAS